MQLGRVERFYHLFLIECLHAKYSGRPARISLRLCGGPGKAQCGEIHPSERHAPPESRRGIPKTTDHPKTANGNPNPGERSGDLSGYPWTSPASSQAWRSNEPGSPEHAG